MGGILRRDLCCSLSRRHAPSASQVIALFWARTVGLIGSNGGRNVLIGRSGRSRFVSNSSRGGRWGLLMCNNLGQRSLARMHDIGSCSLRTGLRQLRMNVRRLGGRCACGVSPKGRRVRGCWRARICWTRRILRPLFLQKT